MGYIKEYFKIIAYMLIGIVFSFSAFYLFINIFHRLELEKDYSVDVSETTMVKDYYKRISTIENNVANFQVSSYQGTVNPSKMLVIQQNIKQCAVILKSTYLEEIGDNDVINIVDVYKLRDSYENKILSDCIINNLYWTLDPKDNNINSKFLIDNKAIMSLYVDALKNNTSYLKKDLLNNSSYYFNTSTASSGVKDNVRDGFYETLSAYKDASLYVEYVSNWFKNEVGGV